MTVATDDAISGKVVTNAPLSEEAARKLGTQIKTESTKGSNSVKKTVQLLAKAHVQNAHGALGQNPLEFAKEFAPIFWEDGSGFKIGRVQFEVYIAAIFDQTGQVIEPAEVRRRLGGSPATVDRAFASLREHKVLPASEQAEKVQKGRDAAGLPTANNPQPAKTDAPKTDEKPATYVKPAANAEVNGTGDDSGDHDQDTPADVQEIVTGMAGQLMADAAEKHANTAKAAPDATPTPDAGEFITLRIAAADMEKALRVLRASGISFEELATVTA